MNQGVLLWGESNTGSNWCTFFFFRISDLRNITPTFYEDCSNRADCLRMSAGLLLPLTCSFPNPDQVPHPITRVLATVTKLQLKRSLICGFAETYFTHIYMALVRCVIMWKCANGAQKERRNRCSSEDGFFAAASVACAWHVERSAPFKLLPSTQKSSTSYMDLNT